MDKLYTTDVFCKHAYTHERKVKDHGVTLEGMRSIPKCAEQENQNKKVLLHVLYIVKAAMLKGDDDIPDLVAKSVCDSKPVNFFSIVRKSFKWIVNKKKVYNVDTEAKESAKFFRMN